MLFCIIDYLLRKLRDNIEAFAESLDCNLHTDIIQCLEFIIIETSLVNKARFRNQIQIPLEAYSRAIASQSTVVWLLTPFVLGKTGHGGISLKIPTPTILSIACLLWNCISLHLIWKPSQYKRWLWCWFLNAKFRFISSTQPLLRIVLRNFWQTRLFCRSCKPFHVEVSRWLSIHVIKRI